MNGADTGRTVGRPRAVGLAVPARAPRLVALLDRLPRRGPAAVLVRAAGAALAATGTGWLYSQKDPGVLCMLRRFTGVPCPLCGSTTVFVDLGSGHPGAAFLANPVTFVAAGVLIVAPLGPGRWWWSASPRSRRMLLAGAIAFSWLWQLDRFHILSLH